MSWKRYNLGELVDSISVRAKDIVHDNNLKFLGVSNEFGITVSKYAAEDKAEDYKIIEKDCFAYNPYRINVGSIGLMKDDLMGLISPAYVVFKPKPKSIIPELLLIGCSILSLTSISTSGSSKVNLVTLFCSSI